MASNIITRYGLNWDTRQYDDLRIELHMIAEGGRWVDDQGRTWGDGTFEHMMRARKLAWPTRYRHRWTDLIYHNVLDNVVAILLGPGSSQKTSHASEIALLRYWARPHDSLCLVSTTTNEKLEAAIFGEIKMLHRDGQARFPWLAGQAIDTKKAISTDVLEEGSESRDIRKGIICRACYVGQRYTGLGVYAGIKQRQITFLADELQFMAPTFFDCLPNMFQSCINDKNNQPDIKVIGSGNPRHDPFDQLSIAAEPLAGWDSVKDVVKTTVWPTKFHRGVCVNLIGTDSPNFDVAEDKRPPYPGLINRQTCKMVEARWPPGSLQHNSQVVGKMMMGMLGNRVLTRRLCEEHHAFEKAVWSNDQLTRLWFLDPAWGGHNADRCVWGWLEFGTEISGRQIMRFGAYMIVPIMGEGGNPDDQIAKFCKSHAISNGIPLENGFYDSTGRGTTGAAFSRIFAGAVPTPVAFGDRPTKRPVRHDLFVTDETTHTKRHKRCDEEYGKYVTELWFSVRNIVECDQMRELNEDVMQEGCMREYSDMPGGKVDVETKDEMRDRIGYSPDLFDALAVGCEGARQLGFRIDKLGYDIVETAPDTDFFDTESREYREMIENQLLNHV